MMWLLLLVLRLVAAVAQRVDDALADFGPEIHDPNDCAACHAADDDVMERFDLNLWSIELQERQP